MSMEEYNKHSILGPLAGHPTSISAIAGQEAYRRNNETPVMHPSSDVPMNLGGVVILLLILAAVGAIALAAVFLLPEKFAAIPAIIAFACVLAMGILSLHAGVEACKIAAGKILGLVFSRSWGWIFGATLIAFIFAETYIYAILPASAWMVALSVAALGIAAKYFRQMRTACAALAVWFVTYTLVVSYIFGTQPVLALLIGAGVAAAVFLGTRLWQARRKEKQAV